MSIIETLTEQIEDSITFTGFDEAIIGYEAKTERVVYSKDKIIQIIARDEGVTYEQALDHFCYDVESVYFGKKTPIIVTIIKGL